LYEQTPATTAVSGWVIMEVAINTISHPKSLACNTCSC